MVQCIHHNARIQYLDVGYVALFVCTTDNEFHGIRFVRCCPGGFSSYILNKNPHATGVGLSLEMERGGHDLLLEDNLRPRLDLHLSDINQYQLGIFLEPGLRSLPFDCNRRQFDLVLLDGHPLHLDPDKNSGRLLIAQLVLALQSISFGGTVVVKLSRVESLTTSKIIYMLDGLSADFKCWKPVCMHATRDTFYAIAKGVGLGPLFPRINEYLTGLKELWVTLASRGIHGEFDLDFIINNHAFEETYKDRFLYFARPLWEVQTKSIQGWVRTNGL